jgi:hypothetical protein
MWRSLLLRIALWLSFAWLLGAGSPARGERSEIFLDASSLASRGSPDNLELAGPWEFYPGQLFDHLSPLPQPYQILERMNQWTNIKTPDGGEYRNLRAATYRLLVKNLPHHPEGYSVVIQHFDSAMKIIIWGRGEKKILAESSGCRRSG